MNILRPMLQEHPFLANFASKHLEILNSCATLQEFEVGNYIFQEAEEANSFYLITKGKVALETSIPKRGAIAVQYLEYGEMLGWSWLIPPYHWRFSARPLYPTEAIVMDGEYLRKQCQSDPVFGYAILERLALVIGQRLEITRIRLLEPINTERI